MTLIFLFFCSWLNRLIAVLLPKARKRSLTSLENLVTHRSKKKSVVTWLSFRPSVSPKHHYILSKQGICWPLSRGHIAGSALELIEVAWFLKLIANVLVFHWPKAQVELLLWGAWGSTCKDKLLAQINSWWVIDFSSDIFLVQSIVSWKVLDILRTQFLQSWY